MTASTTHGAPTTLAEGFVFAEAPRWHAGELWVSDMHGEAVHTVSPSGETTLRLELPGRKPSGIGFLPDGSALIVSMTERALLRLAPDGSCSVHARLEALVADELNDMVVAPDGTAYVGSYPADPPAGLLLRVRPDGSASVAARDLRFPNGTVLSADGRTLIVAESKARRFTAFDVDAHGNLGGRRVVATTPDAAPDGMALDAEGAIWAGFPLAREFRRVLPGGEVTDRVRVGGRMAIACTLGGPDRRTLFLTSASEWDAVELGGAPTSVVETLRVEVPGTGTP
ncbi:SMP-30/gluconolactonase/LRE family protein [Yinghuangia sp. ASG 101]|uniref:SMP-30/gluconolactonase/LRE family protein n=1 Tax=Yinghuangia sp. ASG 101 TaxID=2896848 RepID=UPI001E3E6944|nr:SMP-30/gluconolactonase/LRE family protein [Yinghuangia sp. ASG 101]UGQ11929.1 SMP-30/gluconolactonase/LRE family protein [Yinghuangia sp. ASG 101]